MKAWIGLAVAIGIVLALAAPAEARTDLHASTTRTTEDPGCWLVDLQTLHESIRGWLIDVNGSTHLELLLSGAGAGRRRGGRAGGRRGRCAHDGRRFGRRRDRAHRAVADAGARRARNPAHARSNAEAGDTLVSSELADEIRRAIAG